VNYTDYKKKVNYTACTNGGNVGIVHSLNRLVEFEGPKVIVSFHVVGRLSE